jgi:hypothetical protein
LTTARLAQVTGGSTWATSLVNFEDPTANQPVDLAIEMRGFASWTDRVAGVQLTDEQLAPLFADPGGGEPEDVFVEDTVVRLLRLLGLPLPADLEIGN